LDKDSSVEEDRTDERDTAEVCKIMVGTKKLLENVGHYPSQYTK